MFKLIKKAFKEILLDFAELISNFIANCTELIINFFTNDPKCALHRQYIFWAALILPFVFFLKVGSLYWEGYEFSWTKEGVDTFFEISKIPLYFLSSVIPLMILAARIHGTRQVEEQIKVTQENNTFTNYYKHRELFYEFINKRFRDFKHPINKERLYQLIYPKNNSKYFSLDSDINDIYYETYFRYKGLVELFNELHNTSAEARERTYSLVDLMDRTPKYVNNHEIGPLYFIFRNDEIFDTEKPIWSQEFDSAGDYIDLISDLLNKLTPFTHDTLKSKSKMDAIYKTDVKYSSEQREALDKLIRLTNTE
ncbi:hypothetical protein [Pseudoalteromonas umbrosa]|uniref:hypothetical protein n=1 Tax=Pseudoalteromonas umbrosa TaxID=3048489 RepID=UPI0024C42937|nr:hypothetical protein [Pseudoalteromonas sp. B95]MDK1289832.1 hypothetical protein [Pseudoalteromonas sp. B95]